MEADRHKTAHFTRKWRDENTELVRAEPSKEARMSVLLTPREGHTEQ